MLTFQFSLDENDCKNYLEVAMLESVKQMPKKSKARLMLLALFIIAIFILDDIKESTFPSTSTIIAVFASGLLLYMLFPGRRKLNSFYQKAVVSKVKRFIENPDNESFFESKTYMVGETGIQISSPYSDSSI
ncbi:MAG: hypothetical protein ABIX01_09380 [Chitinophagaceae bacterium]